MLKTSFTALLVISLVSSTLRAETVLVQNGEARSKIYVTPEVMAENAKPAKPGTPWAEKEAEIQRQRLRESVKDLSLYLQKISGSKVDIATEAPPPSGAAGGPSVSILIGDLAVKAFGTPKKQAPYKQGFRFVVTPTQVGLAGESDLATSYAIYELLDRLGCRWFMPSEMGEAIPQLKTVSLAETDISSAPGTIYRGIWYADEDYKRRNRCGGLLLSAGHALEGYVTDQQRKEHPEWVAEVGGKPSPRRLKWSNPDVATAMANFWFNHLEKEYTPSISLSPDDGIDFDESKEDRAIDANDFDTTSQTISNTDRLLVICNRIADQVTKKYPDILFGALAYGPTTRPPVREKVHPNIVPQLAPITYSRAHPMTDDNAPDNKELRMLVEGWGKAAKMTSVYFYGFNLAEPAAPNPMIAKWSVDAPYVLKNKCQFWQPETLSNFETSMHCLYLGLRLAWNPDQKPADVIAEINTRFYGNAASAMTAYWNEIDDAWTKTPEYSGCGFAYLRRWTPERMQQARKHMNAALAACQNDVELQRVRLADDSLDLFELFMKLRRDQAEGRFANLASDSDYWCKRIAFLGEKYQDQFTFTRTRWAPTTLNRTYFEQFYQRTYNDASRIAKDFVVVTPQPLREFRYQADADKSGEVKGWAKPDFDDKQWKTTDVCMESWSTIGYHSWFNSMWYRTEVKLPVVPKSTPEKKIFLWLGSTDGSAKVFVNGQHIPYVDAKKGPRDESDGYCQPFSFDITAAVKPGETNQISILCTRTFFNELGTGGLIGPVTIYREKP